jgi:alpha-beta hydrolase superfamily lysophospholipase
MNTILLVTGWKLAIQAAAFRAGLWGMHPFPRRLPRVAWLLPAAGAALLIGWTAMESGSWRWAMTSIVTLPAGVILSLLSAVLVRRRPEERWARTSHQYGSTLVMQPTTSAFNGTVVVIAHGGGNDRLFGLSYVIDSLLDRGAAVITADLPGHGRQGQDKFSLAACRSRLDAMVSEARRIPGADRVLLLGQSMGGALALDALVRGTNVDGVVSVSAPAELNIGASILRELKALARPSIYRALAYGNLLESLPAVGRFKRKEYPVRITGDLHYLDAFAQAVQAMDLPNRLRRNGTHNRPALLVHGRDDGIIPVEQAYRLSRALGERAELQVFDNVTHLDPLFNRQVVEKVIDWIGADDVLRSHQTQDKGVISCSAPEEFLSSPST